MRRPAASLTAALHILLVAGVLATAANLLSPRRIPWRADWSQRVTDGAREAGLLVVTLAETRALIDGGTHVILDARPEPAFHAGHLPGALSLPVEHFAQRFPDYAPVFTPDTPMLVYCSGSECDESILLGKLLMAEGYTNITLFPGGYSAWIAALPETQP